MGDTASIAAKFAQCLLSAAVPVASFGAFLGHVAWVTPSRFVHVLALDQFYNLTRLFNSQNRLIFGSTEL
jgi:hypothetical protein